MNHILLVVPPGVRPCTGLAHALERAQEKKAKLVALAIIDPDETARIASRLDSAFMGERVGDRVMEALLREQRVHAQDLLSEITKGAENVGVEVIPVIESGDTSEICDRIIRQFGANYAVLVAERRSWLTRLLSRSSSVRLPAFAGCELKVIEEDGDGSNPIT